MGLYEGVNIIILELISNRQEDTYYISLCYYITILCDADAFPVY